MGADDFLTMQAMVLGTSLIGLCAMLGSSRLRLHSMALVASGVIWAIAARVVLPAFASSGGDSDFGNVIGAAIAQDGCVFLLTGIHLLLCIALGLEALRGNRP